MGKAARLKAERRAARLALEEEYEAHLIARLDGRIVCDDCGLDQRYEETVPCLWCDGESGVMLADLWHGTGPVRRRVTLSGRSTTVDRNPLRTPKEESHGTDTG